ncbi:hypothetical protein SAP269_13860 [Spiroplasma ixodetis]|uniref:Uncharacterized protein n=2 Tax=Spiroplasma ixodetis TaxID=2141 RepID=A0ABN7BV22_9MOLU
MVKFTNVSQEKQTLNQCPEQKGGVLSLFFNKNTNFLYVTTWNGDGKTKTNDGSLYKCLATNNAFTLVQKNLPAIWHLKTKDSEPFIELEY